MMGNSLSRYGTVPVSLEKSKKYIKSSFSQKNILACLYTRQNIYRSENHISPSPLKLLLFVFALSRHLNLLLTYIFLSLFSPPTVYGIGRYLFLFPRGNMCSFPRGILYVFLLPGGGGYLLLIPDGGYLFRIPPRGGGRYFQI
jgi:hypothetical protein